MTAHAKLSASGSSRWLNCPGSVNAEAGLANTSSVFAQEGTAAHELGELCLRSRGYTAEWVGKALPENRSFTVDEDMADFVQDYVDYVRSLKGTLEVEVRLDFSHIVPEGFGTSDAVVYHAPSKTLHVNDLKYGKGVKVYAEDNSQGVLYALGAINDYEMLYDIEWVVIGIIQPRLDHIDEWRISKEALIVIGEDIRQKALRCFEPDAPRVAGDKQCTFCRAKASCPALLDYSNKAILQEFSAFEELETVVPLDVLTETQMSNVLSSRKLILSWFDAIEKLAIDKLAKGEPFPGYKLVEGRSSRRWSSDDAAIEVLTPILEDAVYAPREIVSVACAEKLLGKKQKDAINDVVVKAPGRPTIAPLSDKRPALGHCSVEDFDVVVEA